jgi:hypothetical protein
MATQLIGFLWKLPKAHPTAATVITGIGGVIWLIAGIVTAVTPASAYSAQNNVGGAAIFMLLGLVSLGLAVYAAVDTQGFQNWARPNGSYGHAVVRWMGPVMLILSILWLIVGLYIASAALEGMGRK